MSSQREGIDPRRGRRAGRDRDLHRDPVERTLVVWRLEDMEANLRGEDLVRTDAGDCEQMAAFGSEAVNTHSSSSAPRLVHVTQAKCELRLCSIGERCPQMDKGVRGSRSVYPGAR